MTEATYNHPRPLPASVRGFATIAYYQCHWQDWATGQWRLAGVARGSLAYSHDDCLPSDHKQFRRIAWTPFHPAILTNPREVGPSAHIDNKPLYPIDATPAPELVQWHPKYEAEQTEAIGALIWGWRAMRVNTLADNPGECTGHTCSGEDMLAAFQGKPLSNSDLGVVMRGAAPDVFTHRFLTADNYTGDVLYAANIEAFTESYGDHPDVLEMSDGSIAIAADCTDESIIECLAALDGYPLVCEDTHSRLEAEDQESQWDDWGRADFTAALCSWLAHKGQAGKEGEIDPDWADEKQIDALWYAYCEAGGHYPEGSGQSCVFRDIDNHAAFDAHLVVSEAIACFTLPACSASVRVVTGEDAGGGATAVSYDGDVIVELDVNGDCEQPQAAPLGWLNGAGLVTEPGNDSVSVWVSIDDPRGSIRMTVRRMPDGQIMLYVPSATVEGQENHVTLTLARDGAYKVSGS